VYWPEAMIVLKEHGPLRTGQLIEMGLHHRELADMLEAKLVRRLGPGLYCAAKAECSPELVALRRVRRGILCLQSALYFHGLAPRPSRVWVAIPRKSRRPAVDSTAVEIVQFSRASWAGGAERYEREGTTLWVYRPAKAIADCFKFRRRLGATVGRSALEAAIDGGLVTPAELAEFGAACGVRRLLARYLEELGVRAGRSPIAGPRHPQGL
jgi:predicted transcriptional regulator of viral defense system